MRLTELNRNQGCRPIDIETSQSFTSVDS